jgi:hypothetical protein
MGAPSSGAVVGSTAWTQPTATTTTASDNDHHLIPHADGFVTYVSLIQQYLSVFQIDNALWLAERCIADYPLCYDAIYLQALCYYRMGKIKNARACLNQRQYTTTGNENVARSGSNSVSSHSSTLSSMLYLSAQCSFELGDYICAETTLLQSTRTMYKQQQTRDSMGISMDDWILQSTVSLFLRKVFSFMSLCGLAVVVAFLSLSKMKTFTPILFFLNADNIINSYNFKAMPNSKWSCWSSITWKDLP